MRHKSFDLILASLDKGVLSVVHVNVETGGCSSTSNRCKILSCK